MEEAEVKFLSIDPVAMEEKLSDIGAEKIFDKVYRRRVFDYPDLRLNDQGAWIRIRDEGDRVTMAFKQRVGIKTDDGSKNDETMEEIELEVSDFEKMARMFEKIGLKEKFYEENRRIRYRLDNIEFDIDFWPQLDPFLEIEADSWNDINRAIELLELDPEDKKIYSTYQVYQQQGIDENDYQKITFEEMVKK